MLIVDEASMVDLPMMARVLDALPAGARLVLLGDKDQLHSVEAGGVLAELCATGPGSDCTAANDAPVGFLHPQLPQHRAGAGPGRGGQPGRRWTCAPTAADPGRCGRDNC